MKKIVLLAASLFVLNFACVALAAHAQPAGQGELTSGDIKREAGEAVEAAGDLMQQKKEKYLNKTEDALRRFEGRVMDLSDRAGRSGEKVKKRILGAAEILKQKNEAAKGKLRDIKAAGDDRWNKLRNELDSMIADIERSYRRALSIFSSNDKDQQSREE